jgi:hypothetical protein
MLFSFAFIIFLYAAGIFAWSVNQEVYRIAFAGAGVFSASWLLHATGFQMHD